MTGSVDPRGFAYPLEPLLKRQQWDVDALQAKLARLNKTIDGLASQRARIQAAYQEHAGALRTGSGAVLEPSGYGRSLAHLAGLQGEVARLNQELEALEQERRGLQKAWLSSQLKVDITTAHKEACLDEYMSAQTNRQNSESDRGWLARSVHTATEETAC